MLYRKFPKIDFETSVLGFGAMRLPTIEGSMDIDEKETAKMIYTAVDHGVNYIDTAYPYHNKMSEIVVGNVLEHGYRDKVKLATKLPPWEIKEKGDIDRIFEEQCKKLKTDRIDFYLLHAMNEKNWELLTSLDIFEWYEKKIAQGRIGYAGFSFHDKYPVFKKIIDAYDWTFCQIQYNYMDMENQAGIKGLHYAASKDIAVIVMEPLLGGKLVKTPDPIKKIWTSASKQYTPVEWALRWLWNQPEITMVLSGMSSLQQVKDNLEYAKNAEADILTKDEFLLYERVREAYQKLSPIPCTKCEYCMPCPQEVNIPWNFSLYNEGVMYNSAAAVRQEYNYIPENQRANNCISCGICEEHCPQEIKISEWMPKVHSILAEGKNYPAPPE